jgi:hypothetical protein
MDTQSKTPLARPVVFWKGSYWLLSLMDRRWLRACHLTCRKPRADFGKFVFHRILVGSGVKYDCNLNEIFVNDISVRWRAVREP